MRGRVEFAHALVREAVEDELNVLRRARLHRRAADALTALGEDRHLEEIAAHLFQAASVADARQVSAMLVRAGRRARDRLAYGNAAERFDRAREALEFAEAGDEAGPVLLARGDAGARGCLYERLAPYAGRPATSGRAVSSYDAVDRRLGGLAAVLGRREDAIRHRRDAVARDAELGCTVWRAHGLRRLYALAPDDAVAAEASAAALGLPRPAPA